MKTKDEIQRRDGLIEMAYTALVQYHLYPLEKRLEVIEALRKEIFDKEAA